MKRMLMVGAGSCQINAIKKLKATGIYVVAADYNLMTEGKRLADAHEIADAFDEEAIYECAVKHQVDGIMTTGTDQPVLVVARVAERLGLPHFIDSDTALWVTNKKAMKHRFHQFKIPTAPFAVINHQFSPTALMGIKPPYVIKPLDSQGQRGIYKVDTIDEIRQRFDDVLVHSRSHEILVEQYYESTEVTVSGWVRHGKATILTVTDRITFPSEEKIGVCLAHEYPSRHMATYGQKIDDLTGQIVTQFGIEEGPIYFQFLIGDKGIWVNEIACRLGGAYEDVTIPLVTGVDVLALNIEGALGIPLAVLPKEKHALVGAFNTQLFFCNPGEIANMTPVNELKTLPYVVDAGYNFRIGDTIGAVENASQRVGFFIVTGESHEDLKHHVAQVYSLLRIENREGTNLVMPFDYGTTL